ncbi:hypothetical protein BB8028_0004g11460 [Beauveria bassiana]|uniref:MutL C-terminal dimerisation domain-containing protein n=1 Tax=Beauveria bassiana TaxID=176275 RepID=A0A2S7YDG8_BEABA|nr:hypothetical protein BB8028_0004g11460 [Beauveria bassiana]
MSIRPLPKDVIDKITSSSSIVSLNGAVCGLVRNSLDAGARKVNIVLDYVRGNCTVEDDGEGISAEEFSVNGGLAKPNNTSRFPHLSSCHGRHGSFLASLAALSLVIITSNSGNENKSSSVAIHHGVEIPTEATDPAAQHCASFSRGTRVAVFDLFGSMPVRVKHRASVFSAPPYLEKEFKALTYDLTALLLAWPLGVSILLREARRDCQLRLKSGDGLTLDQRTSRLLMQAGLSHFTEATSWVPVAASNGSLSVDGCISTIPVATRSSQFISLGIHPMERSMGGNVLFEEVNEIFTSSSFGILEDHGSSETLADDSSAAQCKPKKGLERWPMFYLRFKSNAANAEDLLRPRSPTLAGIISLLRAVCYAFLKKHKMRPRKRMHNRRRISPGEGDRRLLQDGRSGAEAPRSSMEFLCTFDNWRRIKVGHRAGVTFPQSSNSLKHLIGSRGQLLRPPFVEESQDESFAHSLCSDADIHSIQNFATRNLETLETHCREGHDNWLAKLDESWKNPVFETVESAVHRLPNELCFELCEDSKRTSASTTNISGRIAKSSLANADIIAQVDRKFVLIKLPLVSPVDGDALCTNSAQHALFAVDQHAADERCRLEELMSHYFEPEEHKMSPAIEPLDNPLYFDVAANEFALFTKRKAFWEGWGIRYQLLGAEKGRHGKEPLTRIMVTGLPPSILERCRGEPRLLLDLLRKEMWDGEDQPGFVPTRAPSTPNFQGCPRGILELLHSRACRGAIMFNDELTLAECTSLIRRLAKCSLPFQCAHGRPSMAPLVELGNKTCSVLRTLPGVAFQDDPQASIMPSAGAWADWMS